MTQSCCGGLSHSLSLSPNTILQIRNLSPTPEPKEVTPEPARAFAAAAAMEPSTAELEREKTPDLTITGELCVKAACGAKGCATARRHLAAHGWDL